MRQAMRALAGVLLVSALPAAFAQDRPLTGDEIRKMLVGKKVFARAGNGNLTDFYMNADQTARVSIGNLNDEGTWRMTETGYCATWKQIRQGQERCFTVVRRGSTLYVLNPDGSTSVEILRLID